MTKLIITRPDDWHIHLRDNEHLATTVLHAASQFHRVIVMPNLKPPVVDLVQARLYRERILSFTDDHFDPRMTLYLTDTTTPNIIKEAQASGIVTACKLYPAGSTTHSDSGVSQIETLFPVLAMMQEVDLPLLIHGEVTDPNIDIFDREAVFIDQVLQKIIKDFPQLRIVLEHITTKDAADFVMGSSKNIAATITAHHLLLNRNDLLAGGIRPHYYCLPVLKRQSHQDALIKAATSGNPKFFIGTDSAPHSQETKETTCGCAGIYTAHAAIEFYAEAFEQAQAIDKLEGFVSHFGPDFYKLPRNTEQVTLVKESWTIPANYHFGTSYLIPFRANTTVSWKLLHE